MINKIKPPKFNTPVIGLETAHGVVYLDDVLELTSPKGVKIRGARVVRIDEWSSVPFKVQYRANDGKLRNDAFDLNQCSWCHSAGQIGSRIH